MFGGENTETAPEGYVLLPIPAEFIKGSRAQRQQREDGEEKEKLIEFQRLKPGTSRAEQIARNCRIQDRDRLAAEEDAALQKALKKQYPGAKFAPVDQMAAKEQTKKYTARGKGKKGSSSSSSMMTDDGGDGKETKKSAKEGEEEEEEERSAGLGLGDFGKARKQQQQKSSNKKKKKPSFAMSLGDGEDTKNNDDEEDPIEPVFVSSKPSVEMRGKRKMNAPAAVEPDEDNGEMGEDQMDSSGNNGSNNSNRSRVIFEDSKATGFAEWDVPDPDMLAGFRRMEGKDMATRMNQYSDAYRDKTVAELRRHLEQAKAAKAQVVQKQQQQQQQGPPSSGNKSQSQGGSSMDETS
jgi:hypothetical protein